MFVIKNRKIFFFISGLLVILSVLAIIFFGLKPGIDFTGGSILEIEYVANSNTNKTTSPVATTTNAVFADDSRISTDTTSSTSTIVSIDVEVAKPSSEEIKEAVESTGASGVLVQQTGKNGYIIRTKSITEDERREIISALVFDGEYKMEEKRFNSIGPVIGKELRSKAWIAIATVIIAIILFIAYVFRHVGERVSSWRYGVIAIIALVHDILIPTGFVALLGLEVDSLFVIALLAILGLSVNDTIVVFDRVRENLKLGISRNFSETVGKSLNQTYVRSINTSITTLFVVLTLFFLGPETIKDFALVLALGLIAGTYSSIFLASPLLVEVERFGRGNEEVSAKKKKKKKKK